MPINICSPVDAYWNQFNIFYRKEFHCVDEGIALPFGAALSAVSDLWGCLLPILLLRQLQLPAKQKWLLYGLFALGFLWVPPSHLPSVYQLWN